MEVMMREYIEQELKKYKFPGMGVGVIKDGKVLLNHGFGFKNVEEGTRIDGDTQWGIASCTKAFTATLLGMLVDEGYFTFDQPIKEYLPDFEMYDPVATQQCTLRDMLCHRTGLGCFDALWTDGQNKTRAELWDVLKYLKPNVPFRTKAQYNNVIYIIAGHIAERVTGKTWEELIKERIFEPLGMNTSNTSVSDMLKYDNVATPYWQGEDGPVQVENWAIDLCGPAGGINSTINDMLKWLQFNVDKGVANGKRLVQESTMEEMHLTNIRYPLWPWKFTENAPVGGYAMGWYNDMYRGNFMYWHLGEIEGYGTMQIVLPDVNMGLILYNNVHEPDVLIQCSVAYTIIDKVLGLPEIDWSQRFWEQIDNHGYMYGDWKADLIGDTQVSGTELSHDISQYLGEYYEEAHGKAQILMENGQLKLYFNGMMHDMQHYHYDVFRIENIKMDTVLVTVPLAFHTNMFDGSIDSFELRLYESTDPLCFKRAI